jgi:hypothetical protein
MEPKFEPSTQLDVDTVNDILGAAVEGRTPSVEASLSFVGIDENGRDMLAREFASKGNGMIADELLKLAEGGDSAGSGLDISVIFATTGFTAYTLGVIYERERLTRQLAEAHEAAALPEA